MAPPRVQAKSQPGTTKPKPSSNAPSSDHRRQKTVKAPRPVEEQLQRHFTSLCAQIDGGFPKNAIKTCDKILRISPSDNDVVRTKLFLLLQTDQYAAALKLLESLETSDAKPSGSTGDYQFDKAYVLYRLHREDEAADILGTLNSSAVEAERGVQHLDAQIKYRKGEYIAARDVYNTLLDTCPPDTDEHPDLLTNLAAAQTHIDFLEKGYLTAVNYLSSPISDLEHAPPPALPTAHVLQPSRAANTEAAPVTKTPRKSRVPKHVVLGVTPLPDPERWLKKRERTRVEGRGGRKGKKKEGMGAGATQGSAVVPDKPAVATPTGGASGGKKGKKGR